MQREIQEVWGCHLCGAFLNITEKGKSGWVKLTVSNPYSGKILNRVVCTSCVKEIKSK